MMRIFAITVLLTTLLISGCATHQRSDKGSSVEKEDKIYIPENLEDSFVQLKKLLTSEDIEKMKSGTEDDMILYHLGLGMWIRNSWGLWGGSRLAKWFNAQGIRHPDDMSGIILDSFWRHLNQKPIRLEEQVKHYQDYWERQETSYNRIQGAAQC